MDVEDVGSGWSSTIPNYNPREITDNLKLLIARETKLKHMDPWYRRFIGEIEKKKLVSYVSTGIYEIVGETTLVITELPIGIWTQNYKKYLQKELGIQFPEDLRVFVLDEDPEYLLTLDTHLQKFQYQVTTCNEESRAMDLLRKDSFDIAIIEVQAQNSNDDRFRLFSQIRSEMNIPIIIMCKDYSVESVIFWMKNGACDYLLKPISPEDLRLIYKHLVTKKIQIGSSIVAAAGEAENSSFVGDSDIRNPNKRKRSLSEDQDDHEQPSTSKKRRVVWDEMLHKKFIEAVEYLGNDKAVPKKILEYMNVEHITRENVASHLQKFRMNIKKRNEQNEGSKQDSRIYGGQETTNFYRDTNVQFSAPHTSSLQPCVSQHEDIQPNITSQLLSPLGHHHHLDDGVSVAVSNGNLMMSHHYQTSELAYVENAEESLGYNRFETHDEDAIVVKNLTSLLMQNQQEVGLFHYEEPSTSGHHLTTFLEINPQQMMNAHESQPSMLHYPSYTHSSFPEEPQILNMADESGGFNHNRDYSVNNTRLTKYESR